LRPAWNGLWSSARTLACGAAYRKTNGVLSNAVLPAPVAPAESHTLIDRIRWSQVLDHWACLGAGTTVTCTLRCLHDLAAGEALRMCGIDLGGLHGLGMFNSWSIDSGTKFARRDHWGD